MMSNTPDQAITCDAPLLRISTTHKKRCNYDLYVYTLLSKNDKGLYVLPPLLKKYKMRHSTIAHINHLEIHNSQHLSHINL